MAYTDYGRHLIIMILHIPMVVDEEKVKKGSNHS